MNQYYIGLLSGTSMDGVDAAIVDINTHNLLAAITIDYPEHLHQKLLSAMEKQQLSFKDFGTLNLKIGEIFAMAAQKVMAHAGMKPQDIIAIGSHGQTLYHHPFELGFSLQLGCAHTIAEMTKLPVIADFRNRDMVLGGQGAPIAPLYHQQLFGKFSPCVVVNIGGITNMTHLDEKAQILSAYDIGPGNVLMDFWIQQHCGKKYDDNGLWAKKGQVIELLLDDLLRDPYYLQPSPKSLDKHYFLKTPMTSMKVFKPEDVQATFLELTAQAIAKAISVIPEPCESVFICGGGAYNNTLLQRLSSLLPNQKVKSTQSIDIDPNYIEAMLFAWLAAKYMQSTKMPLSEFTGANHDTCAGVLYNYIG